MEESILFQPRRLNDSLTLKNRIVMAPMTRSRALGNVPNDLMATYYAQRASAGLMITEGTAPDANGLGYPRIPGLFRQDQIDGWRKVTEAVHQQDGKIIVQLMHTGRVSHPANMPIGAVILGPSAISPTGTIRTDRMGAQPFPLPRAMTAEDINHTKQAYVTASVRALEAGFDGVELHGANGYLLEQFLSPLSNHRSDAYGGHFQKRCRFVLEVAEAVAGRIGAEKTAMRLSPYGVSNSMGPYPDLDETYAYLAEELNRLNLLYLHLVDHSTMGAPTVPITIKQLIRDRFHQPLILSGGYDKARAERDLKSGFADLIAFGRLFINNPDLPARLQHDWPLNTAFNRETFYSPEAKGYTDFPVYRPPVKKEAYDA